MVLFCVRGGRHFPAAVWRAAELHWGECGHNLGNVAICWRWREWAAGWPAQLLALTLALWPVTWPAAEAHVAKAGVTGQCQ